jgi:hypothetical protein
VAWAEWDILSGIAELPAQVVSGGERRGAPLPVRLAFLAAVVAAGIVLWRPTTQAARIAASAAVVLTAGVWVCVRAYFRSVKRRWAFTATEVQFERRSPLRRWSWAEPLAGYRGVLGRREWRGEGEQGELWHLLTLEHASDPRRTVKLFESRSGEGFRRRHESAARLFGLPYLLQTSDGVQERAVADLDRSVRERVAAGDVEATVDPGQPPEGVVVAKVEGDTMTIGTGKHWLGVVGAVIAPVVAAIGVAAAAVGAACLEAGFAIGGPVLRMGLFWAAFGAGGAAVSRLLREELTIAPGGISYRLRHPWGVLREQSLAADAIEEVVISGANSTAVPSLAPVRLIADSGEVRFGRFLSRRADGASPCMTGRGRVGSAARRGRPAPGRISKRTETAGSPLPATSWGDKPARREPRWRAS